MALLTLPIEVVGAAVVEPVVVSADTKRLDEFFFAASNLDYQNIVLSIYVYAADIRSKLTWAIELLCVCITYLEREIFCFDLYVTCEMRFIPN